MDETQSLVGQSICGEHTTHSQAHTSKDEAEAHRVRQGVELGAVVEDELGKGGEPREAGAPGGNIRAEVPQPAAVLERQALQIPELAQACQQQIPQNQSPTV
jgi:hypothetical protein